jgi:hypothetical protein
MEKTETVTERTKTHWAIALDWYQQNNRSISTLIRDYLCPECARRLSEGGKNIPTEDLISTIQNCCSRQPDFFNERLPILESVFRLFLSNGNNPLELDELGQELGRLRGGDTYRTSPEVLLRILKSDGFYGLQETEDS